MAVAVADLVKDALFGLNIYSPGEAVKDADAEYCVRALNAIFDDWNAERQALYANTFSTFTTTPGLNPHTIGPTGTWVLPSRPVSIEAAAVSIGSGQWSPIRVYTDPAWYDRQTTTSLSIPGPIYYNPTEPNGELYFVGVPSGASSIRLLTRSVLAAVVLTDSLNLPDGYRSALLLTLMETIAETFGRPLSPKLEATAGKARARIFANNVKVPSLLTRGLGWPLAPGRFDILTMSWS